MARSARQRSVMGSFEFEADAKAVLVLVPIGAEKDESPDFVRIVYV